MRNQRRNALFLTVLFSFVCSSLGATDCGDANPFDDMPCGCENQFILRDDCTKGFFCADPGAGNFGCLQECGPGEAVRPSFNNQSMTCIPEQDNPVCPGDFEVSCADVGSDFVNNVPCDPNCDGQVWVSADCREAFYCYDRNPQKGLSLICDVDHVVGFNLNTQQWFCLPDEGQCPGLGGYILLKCPGDLAPTRTPPAPADNFEGETCGCEGQIFVNHDCSAVFQCGPDYLENKGFKQECADPLNEIIRISFKEEIGQCIPRENHVCTGNWNNQCPNDPVPDDFIGEDCVCDGQIMVSSDCQRGLYCYKLLPGGGELITCEDGEIVNLRLTDNDGSFGCIEDQGQCPTGMGGFNLIPDTDECNANVTPDPSAPTDAPTQPTGNPGTQPTDNPGTQGTDNPGTQPGTDQPPSTTPNGAGTTSLAMIACILPMALLAAL